MILPAAGRGSRFTGVAAWAGVTGSASKIELELEGRAVFLRAIDLFLGRPEVTQVVLAVDPGRFDEFLFRWGEQLSFMKVDVVRGGTAERWETVAAALGRVREDATHVAVHDAARPATPGPVLDRVFAAAAEHDAVIPGLAVADTLKRIDARGGRAAVRSAEAGRVDAILGLGGDEVGGGSGPTDDVRGLRGDGLVGVVSETVSREGLVGVQTPQVFRAELLREAYAALASDPSAMAGVTDDASLLERRGVAVTVVAGDPGNVKLTRPEDASLLSALLRYRQAEAKKADAVKALFGDDEED